MRQQESNDKLLQRVNTNYAMLAVKAAKQQQALLAARSFIEKAVYEFKGDAQAAVEVLKQINEALK